MYLGSFTNPFVLRYDSDVENVCHTYIVILIFPPKVLVGGRCFKTISFIVIFDSHFNIPLSYLLCLRNEDKY